jgi:hypothetical protein
MDKCALVALALELAGCTSTIEIPGEPRAALVQPRCLLFCRSSVAVIAYPLAAGGAQSVTANPTITITQGKDNALAGGKQERQRERQRDRGQ